MALIKCTECGTEISSEAKACPKCGYSCSETVEGSSKQFALEMSGRGESSELRGWMLIILGGIMCVIWLILAIATDKMDKMSGLLGIALMTMSSVYGIDLKLQGGLLKILADSYAEYITNAETLKEDLKVVINDEIKRIEDKSKTKD